MRIESIPTIPRIEVLRKEDEIKSGLIFAINQELRRSPGVDWLGCYKTRLSALYGALRLKDSKFEEAEKRINKLNEKIDEIREEGSLEKRRPELITDYLDFYKFINN